MEAHSSYNFQRQLHNMEEKRKLLIVEDDLNLGFLLMDFLEEENYQVKLCRDGQAGLEQFRKHKYDLCLLDVMVPKIDGFELARKMRDEDDQVKFLFLTARTLKDDRIKGYKLGAEDYITKPFDEEELACKIHAILRRSEPTSSDAVPTHFQIGSIRYDYGRQLLEFSDRELRLTEKENEVLRLLCLRQNQILNREDAVKEIYGKWDYFLGRSFDVFISKLRKYLSADPAVRIENVYKVGFILSVD